MAKSRRPRRTPPPPPPPPLGQALAAAGRALDRAILAPAAQPRRGAPRGEPVALRHRAVDVPRLHERLLEYWTSGDDPTTGEPGVGPLELLMMEHADALHFPYHSVDHVRQTALRFSILEWGAWLRNAMRKAADPEVDGLFYVTEDMTDVVRHTAAQMPRYQVYEDQLPAPYGFVVYAKPVAEAPAEVLLPGQRVEINAAVWGPVEETGDGPGVMLVTLQDTGVQIGTQPAWRDDPDTVDVACRMKGPLSYHEEYPMGYGNGDWAPDVTAKVAELTGQPDALQLRMRNNAVAAVMSTWIMMGQRISDVAREPLPRAARRQYERAGRPAPAVRTVGLRRRSTPARQEQQPGQEGSRTYTHRWPVKGYGYLRNTWYPSRQRHELQFVEVPGYMKGPEGAPIIDAKRVNVLRR